ncbi:SurA N-terminal domain-containing protein [Gaetbulibacter sp. M240]|uniref:SurA N-terminal domain-containing protein n=1 Tax=Gaetbulibacter sp. M240 TaxID=3126511 RepID=UPI00374F5447
MAVLNKIRQRSLFLILIIALALFSFVLADLFKNNSGFDTKSQNTVATINGKDITRTEFMSQVEMMQQQMGPNATNSQVMNRVWDQMVRKTILENQFEQLGISVEKDQMRDLLKNTLASAPEFLDENGLFDENKLNEFIANLKEIAPQPGFLGGQPITFSDWTNYEKNLEQNALQQEYFNLVKAGLTGTLAEGKLENELEGNKRDIKYVQIPYTSIADSVIKVSKSDVSDYIKDHKSNYQVEASRDIRYVQFKEEASVEDENKIKEDLNALLTNRAEYNQVTKLTDTIKGFLETEDNEDFINVNSDLKFNPQFLFKNQLPTAVSDSLFNLNVGEIFGVFKDGGYYKISKLLAVKQIPDSAKVRHILIPFIGSTRATPDITKTDAEAKATADSIYTIVSKDRSKFTDLLDLSSDKVSNEKDGEIEFSYRDAFAPEFKDFSFFNKVGSLDVVKTSFGYHVIEILEQTEKQKAVQIGTLARKIEPSEETIDMVFRDASNFEITVAEKDFEEVAKETDYAVRPVNKIKALDESIPGIGNQRQIVRWAFEEETEIGAVKRFTITGGYVIAQLVAKHEAGLMSVDDATASVLPIIRKEKKAELIRDRVTASSLEDIAKAENTTVKTASAITMKNPTIAGAGSEPMVVGAAFALNEGETSGLIDGEKGVYMVEVTKVTPAVELDNYQAAANRVQNQKLAVVTSKLYQALQDAAEIEDNRAKIQIQ